MAGGMTHYVPTPGTPEAREAVAAKLRDENDIDCTADHVCINNGAKFTVFLALQALLNPGDEVVLPTPAWVSYKPMIELAGGVMVEVATDASSSFKMTPQQLDAAITPRTKVLLLNSPSNPCGTMYVPSMKFMSWSRYLERHPHVTVVSDEIYERLVYGDDPNLSMGSLPSMRDRVVTINGLSKSFAMTGWRIGYACAPGR